MQSPVDLNALAEKIRQEAGRHAEAPDQRFPRLPPDGRNLSALVSLIQDPTPEPAQAGAVQGWWDLMHHDDATFVRTAYLRLLGRPVDGAGLDHFLRHLGTGTLTRLDVLWGLIHSDEGRSRRVHVQGLRRARLLEHVTRIRWIGRPFAILLDLLRLPSHLLRIERRFSEVAVRLERITTQTNAGLMGVRRALVSLETVARGAQANSEHAIAQLSGIADHARTLDDQIVGLDRRLEEPAWRGLQTLHEKLLEQQRVLTELAAEARTRLPALLDGEEVRTLADMTDGRLEPLYVALEDRFRGDRATIEARLSRYLPAVRATPPIQSGGLVLDIGCGRGEWLALLGKAGLGARGLDLSHAMVALCKDVGLDAVHGDAVGHLRTLPDGSLAAITAFHVVEHLRFRDLLDLLDEARRVLAPGGLLLFETPNPENLVVGACTFRLDPTHQFPLPPELLRFLAINRGFAHARIVRTEEDLDPDIPERGFVPVEVNDWFRAPPDYALLASKAR